MHRARQIRPVVAGKAGRHIELLSRDGEGRLSIRSDPGVGAFEGKRHQPRLVGFGDHQVARLAVRADDHIIDGSQMFVVRADGLGTDKFAGPIVLGR